jgi:hypothetical protein
VHHSPRQTDTDLIRARTYELQIYKPHLDAERARAQAMREFKSGTLKPPEVQSSIKKSIPRRNLKTAMPPPRAEA